MAPLWLAVVLWALVSPASPVLPEDTAPSVALSPEIAEASAVGVTDTLPEFPELVEAPEVAVELVVTAPVEPVAPVAPVEPELAVVWVSQVLKKAKQAESTWVAPLLPEPPL